jgi:ATP-dependent RNA helicase DDX42
VSSYFDEDDDEAEASTEVLRPAAFVDEVDPLDAFMDANSSLVAEQAKSMGVERAKAARLDEEQPDEIDAVLNFYDSDGNRLEEEEEEECDSDGEKRAIEALPPLDHSAIDYEPFRKAFYTPHPDVASMSAQAVGELAAELELAATGEDAPRPIRSFKHAGLEDGLLRAIVKRGYEAPTPVQAAALPVALSGRDLVGLAQTGSGKTLAFVWPMVVHVSDQRPLARGEGPIGLVLAPTRELVEQIHTEMAKFLKPRRSVAIVGGAGKYEMVLALKAGCEVVVATPGRLMELLGKKATNLRRTTLVVLDEADRMFDMGFEDQIRSILDQVRPDRQTLLFSATFKRRVEALATRALSNPVRLQVGTAGAANADVRQEFVVVRSDGEKWAWLAANLPGLLQHGKVLVFVAQKAAAETLASSLRASVAVSCLHGDMDQGGRSQAVKLFKAGQTTVLVATDVAARGLDIKGVTHVVSFDASRSVEGHVHRIGRTGRLGLEGVVPGTAHTLLTQRDSAFAAELVTNLRVSEQPVPPCLSDLAAVGKGGKGGGGKGGGGKGGFSGSGGKGYSSGGGGKEYSGGSTSGRGGGEGRASQRASSDASQGALGYSAAPPPQAAPTITLGEGFDAGPAALGGGPKKRPHWDN